MKRSCWYRTCSRTAVTAVVGLLLAACTPTINPDAARGVISAVTAGAPVDAILDDSSANQAEPGLAAPRVLHLRARDGFDADAVDTVRQLAFVETVSMVRSDTIGLFGEIDARGVDQLNLADGYQIPVQATSVDPSSYPDAPPEFAQLQPGTVLITESGQHLRQAGVGGTLHLGDTVLTIVGTVSAGLGRSELVVHATDADDAGIAPGGSLLIAHQLDVPIDDPHFIELVERLRELLPDEGFARLDGMPGNIDLLQDNWPSQSADGGAQHSGDVDDAPSGPLVLSLPQTKQQFGEFAFRPRAGMREIDVERGWIEDHIVTTAVPVLGNVTCHRAIIDDLTDAIEAVVDAGLQEHLAPSRYGGCFYPRRINHDRARLSSHSWGIAIDLNVDVSMPGLGPVPPDEFIEIFRRNGFRWGGEFTSPDNHHYEWIGHHPAASNP